MSIWPQHDSFRQISFGIFPMVMYTGYAIFPPKTVSCVLSMDTISGMTVTPGCSDSSNSWLCSSVQRLDKFCVAYLYGPPPITCIHVAIHSLHSLIIHVVLLWSKSQVLHKLRISIDCADTIQDVAKMKLKAFISNVDLLALE